MRQRFGSSGTLRPSVSVSRLLRWGFIFLLLVGTNSTQAQSTASSVVLLDILPEGVAAELQLPLSDLQRVFGQPVTPHPRLLATRLGSQLQAYLSAHVHALSSDQRSWRVAVRKLTVQTAGNPDPKLIAQLWLQPPTDSDTRTFTLDYDVIIHQVVTHTAQVIIRRDWEAGWGSGKPVDVGVIRLDVPSHTIPPLQISQGKISVWQGLHRLLVRAISASPRDPEPPALIGAIVLLPILLWIGQKRRRMSSSGH